MNVKIFKSVTTTFKILFIYSFILLRSIALLRPGFDIFQIQPWRG